MREPEFDDLPRRRILTVPRLLLIVGAGVAVVAVGMVARMGDGVGGLAPTSSRGPAGSPPPRETLSPASGAADASGASGAAESSAADPAQVLAPPAGSQVQDVLRGTGTLKYRCSAGKYTLTRTSMKLYIEHGGYAGTQTGLLSWRFKNGVRVDGALVSQVRSSTTLSRALFRVVKVHGGNANDRATTYIARMPDSGGLPPATCTTTGKRLSVPFTTRYIFYRSA